MKETKVHKKKMPEITPPANFTVISHVDRRDTVDSLVNALQTPVVPLSSHGYFPESLPLPRKATGGSYASGGGGTLGRGSAPRGQTPRTPLTPSLFSSSTSNLHRDTVSSGYGTWNAGAKGKIKRGMLSTAEFLVPKSHAPQIPSPSSPASSDGRYLSAGARHARSVSASNDDVSLHTLGYVNVKPFGQPYLDPHASYTHAENDGYLKPYTVLKPNPPPHRPVSSSPKGRSSTVHVHQEIDVIFRPPREVAPPPPRDSHHETDSTTFIAAPERITIQLARPTDLFGPGPGLGLGLGALGSSGTGTIGIDDVVPLPCPGSLDSGVSEPPFPAPAAQPDPAPHKSISPEEVKEYLHKLRDYYSDLKDRDQLDSEGYILRENLLKPAAEQILADLQGMESHKKRPAPAPPVNGGAPHAPLGASPAPSEDAITPTASTRPVPKPRTTKPSSGTSASSSGAATPVGDAAAAAAAAPPFAAAPAALPEAAVQLNPATLKLAPAHSQLAKVLPSDDDDDEEMTRL